MDFIIYSEDFFPLLNGTTIASSLSNKYFESVVSVWIGFISFLSSTKSNFLGLNFVLFVSLSSSVAVVTPSEYFPKSYTPKQMEEVIIRLLEQWQRKKLREQER